MKLPRREEVRIPRRKLTHYLLAAEHPIGWTKAEYFESRGYSPSDPQILAATIWTAAQVGNVVGMAATRWGTKYIVVADLTAPDGNRMTLATVWIVSDPDPPTFVTAYPTRR